LSHRTNLLLHWIRREEMKKGEARKNLRMSPKKGKKRRRKRRW
jgi:hypothetical protein